jgi:hypothetical protein
MHSNSSLSHDLLDQRAHRYRIAEKVFITLAVIASCFMASILLEQASPITIAITFCGALLVPMAIIRPWFGFIAFLWTVHTFDFLKRIVYSVTELTYETIAQILIVPLLIMFGIYLKVFLLNWFGKYEMPKVQYLKFLPLALISLGGLGMLFRGGMDMQAVKANYPLVFFIPAGIAIPYVLHNRKFQIAFAKQVFYLLLVEGIYGIIQSIWGPFEFERQYMESGLSITIGLIEGVDHFRSFSLLNASSTYAGFMAIGTFFSIAWLCRKEGRIVWKKSTILVVLFCIVTCFLATQRGALGCFLITLCLLPVFTRPKMFLAAFLLGLFLYSQLIVYALQLKDFMYVLNDFLASYAHGSLLEQNAGILTLGQRLDGFADMSDPRLWTPFGISTSVTQGGTAAHDLVSNLLEWFGYVGLTFFLILVLVMMYIAISQMARLRKGTWIYLWSQVNLAVFLFILIWSVLLGSTIHVTPINFYFWISIGNLIFIHQVLAKDAKLESAIHPGKVLDVSDSLAVTSSEATGTRVRSRIARNGPGTFRRPTLHRPSIHRTNGS